MALAKFRTVLLALASAVPEMKDARKETTGESFLTTVGNQVQVEVIRLDGSLGGEAVLTARWAIVGEDSRKLLYTRTSS